MICVDRNNSNKIRIEISSNESYFPKTYFIYSCSLKKDRKKQRKTYMKKLGKIIQEAQEKTNLLSVASSIPI